MQIHLPKPNPYCIASRKRHEAFAATGTLIKQKGIISSLRGQLLKLADQLTCLGSNISSTERDVNIRLAKAWDVIDWLSIMWKFCYIAVEGWRTAFPYKNIPLFIFQSFCERDRGRQWDKDRLLYWPITSSLRHRTLCYLQDPYLALLLLGRGTLPEVAVVPLPPASALSNSKLALTRTDSTCL